MCASVDDLGAKVPISVPAQASCGDRLGTAPIWSDASSVAKLNTETGVDCGRRSGGPSKFHVLYLLRPAIAEFLWDRDEDRLSIRASTDRHRDLPKSDRANAVAIGGRPCVQPVWGCVGVTWLASRRSKPSGIDSIPGVVPDTSVMPYCQTIELVVGSITTTRFR